MLLDVPAWVEQHLIDQLCVSALSDVPEEGRIGRIAYALWNDFARQFTQLVEAHRGRCRAGVPILTASSYGPRPDFVGVETWSFLRPEVQEELMRSAVRGGADELIFYVLCQEYNGERELWATLELVCRRVLSKPEE